LPSCSSGPKPPLSLTSELVESLKPLPLVTVRLYLC
jgi:hypothetical protein